MKTAQKDIFLKGEGDAWFNRNVSQEISKEKLEKDPVLRALNACALKPHSILEIGCANGWRLAAMEQRFHAQCSGIEPGKEAVEEGKKLWPTLDLKVGTAETLPFEKQQFDLVIFGFSLYLCDRGDLFHIAAEADRVLKEGGHIVLYDFQAPRAYRNRYSHHEGLYSYKMDYSSMFSWNPSYTCAFQQVMHHGGGHDIVKVDDRIAVTILLKDMQNAYPDNPYR